MQLRSERGRCRAGRRVASTVTVDKVDLLELAAFRNELACARQHAVDGEHRCQISPCLEHVERGGLVVQRARVQQRESAGYQRHRGRGRKLLCLITGYSERQTSEVNRHDCQIESKMISTGGETNLAWAPRKRRQTQVGRTKRTTGRYSWLRAVGRPRSLSSRRTTTPWARQSRAARCLRTRTEATQRGRRGH